MRLAVLYPCPNLFVRRGVGDKSNVDDKVN
jgi:hypothetical protein